MLSISSFRSCINQDFSAKTGTEGVGQNGTYLDCQGFERKVTILDLRITPSDTGSEAEFVFNLTVVPSQANNRREPSDPNFCGAPEGEDCVLTDLATIRVTRSRAILFYQLRRLTDYLPNYCHVFHQVANTPIIDTCIGCVNPNKVFGCWGWPYWDSVQVAQAPGQLSTGSVFFQKFSDLSGIARGCPSTTRCGQFCNGAPANVTKCRAVRQQFWHIDNNTTDTSPMMAQTYFGFDSIRRNPDFTFDFNLPLPDPFPGPVVFSLDSASGAYAQGFHCFGSGCQATSNAHAFSVGTGTSPQPDPPNVNPVRAESSDINIAQLEPLCQVYVVDSVPRFAVTVDIEVKNHVTGNVETLTINNISPNIRESSLQKFISGRIVSVDTVDGYTGPFVSGLVVICGGKLIPHSGTQQTQFASQITGVPNFNYTDTLFWDMRDVADPGSPVQDNPWDTLIPEIQEARPEYDRFYPTNFQLNPLHPEESSVMWYYVAPDRAATMNRNCGGIAFTDQWFSTSGVEAAPNRFTAQQACLHRPDLCMPGSFDGDVLDPLLDNGIPGCLAALAFTILSNATARAQILALPFGQARLNYIEKIATLSMPGSVGNTKTAHSYNSANPQWFIADTQRLYYDPGNITFLNDLSFEVVLDVAAEFVRYQINVSNGKILVTNSSCVNIAGDINGNFTIGVENTGTFPQRYIVTIECNPALGYDGPTTFNTDLLDVGESQFQNVIWKQSGGVPPAQDRNCLLSLIPGEAVIQAYLDNVTVGCTVNLPPSPTFKFNGSALDPSLRPNITGGCACWNFGCHENLTDSWCFLGLMIFFGIIGLGILATIITLVASEISYSETRKHALESKKRRMQDFDRKIQPNPSREEIEGLMARHR